MAHVAILALSVLLLLVGQAEMTTLLTETTFEYGGDGYWIVIDWLGGIDFDKAQLACQDKYEAEITTITSEPLYSTLESQVVDNIPSGKENVTLWTKNSQTAGTRVLLVMWREESEETNSKVDKLPGYEAQGYICRKKVNPPGRSYYFEYEEEEYWFHIDWWGKFNLTESETECNKKYLAEVVKVMNKDQCMEIQKQVEYRIPMDWNGVMLWTGNSDSEETNAMMVIWRPGAGGPNKKESLPPNYKGNGYICHKRKNQPGKTYDFDHSGDKYWFRIGQSDSTTFADAEIACRNEYFAEVMSYYDDAQFSEVLKQVEYRIPFDLVDAATLWTNDTELPETNVVLVISREGSGKPSVKEDHHPNFEARGFLCQMKMNKPGTTYQFEYQNNKYWFKMELGRTFNYTDAENACMKDHDASLASASGAGVYAEMQKRIQFRIPEVKDDFMLWTGDSELAGTNVLLVVWREGADGTNAKENHPTNFAADGYVCQKAIAI